MSGITKSKGDPGWNDPPMLNFSASNPPPKSRIGNKRIAFPLSGNQVPTTQTTQAHSSLPPLQNVQTSNVDELLEHVLQNVTKTLNGVDDSAGIVASKIGVMKEMWLEKKFNDKMKNNILDMSKCLAEGNLEKVKQYQLELMMENAALCNPWISGFTSILNYLTK